MRYDRIDDHIPMQLGPKVPSTAVTQEREHAAAQSFGRVLFESVDLGSLVGITEAECQQVKAPATAVRPHPLFGMLVPLVIVIGDGAVPELDAFDLFVSR